MNQATKRICQYLSTAALLLAVAAHSNALELSSEDRLQLISRASLMREAMLTQDADSVASLTHESVAAFRLNRSLTESARSTFSKMRDIGLVITKVDFGELSPAYESPENIVCFLPYEAHADTYKIRGRMVGYFMAIRKKPDGKWTFVDASALRRRPEILKNLAPTLPEGVPSLPIELHLNDVPQQAESNLP